MLQEQDVIIELRRLYKVIHEIDKAADALTKKEKLKPGELAQQKLLQHLQDVYYK
jgi:hypothetical protein